MKFIPILLLLVICSCRPSADFKYGVKNVKPGNIQFFETYKLYEILDSWKAACIWVDDQDTLEQGENPNSLGTLVHLSDENVVGYVAEKDIITVDSLLALPGVKNNFQKDLHFMWSSEPDDDSEFKGMYVLYAVKAPDGKPAPIDGRHIKTATSKVTDHSVVISLTMTQQGDHDWEIMTGNNMGRCIAITIDNKVLSCPLVYSVIVGGNTEISGNFSKKEAANLADRINAGK